MGSRGEHKVNYNKIVHKSNTKVAELLENVEMYLKIFFFLQKKFLITNYSMFSR